MSRGGKEHTNYNETGYWHGIGAALNTVVNRISLSLARLKPNYPGSP
jgi:hypothetical protein